VTDGNQNRPSQGHGAAAAAGGGRGPAAVGAAAGATKRHQVLKFSPDGKLLMTLGKPGGGARRYSSGWRRSSKSSRSGRDKTT
jgi:hypothetical protein